MDANDSLLTRVERFEDYCIQKRTLEGEIEHALVRREEKAIEIIEIAERELDSVKLECTDIEARIQKARRRAFSSTEESQGAVKGGPVESRITVQELRPPSAAITSSQNSEAQITRPGSYEIVSLPTTPLTLTPTTDSESFSKSVNSCPEPSMTGTGCKSLEAPEGDISDDYITSLVQQYADLCHERQALQGEIEEKLERKERIAQEKLACAKVALYTTRQNSVEIVAALMEASGGDAQIRAPITRLHNAEAQSDLIGEEEFRYPSNVTAATSPFYTSTFSPNSSTRRASVAMSILPPVPPLASTLPSRPKLSLHSDLATSTTGLPPSMMSQAMAPTLMKVVPTSNPQVEEWEAAIFRIYDNLMPPAIAARSGVSSMDLPWPVLEFEAQYYSTTTIKDKDIKQDIVSDFIYTYSAWKGWSFQVAREKMKTDWESIQNVFPKEKAGKKRVVNVVKCITAAV
jgi:hypothetical protein